MCDWKKVGKGSFVNQRIEESQPGSETGLSAGEGVWRPGRGQGTHTARGHGSGGGGGHRGRLPAYTGLGCA
jgi:hypothetical protein